MNIDLRFQDWSLVLAGANVRQYDDHAHTLRVTGDLPEGWQWKLYASVFSEAYFNAIPLTEAEGVLSAVLTRDDLAFGDTTYTLQLVGEHEAARRHTNPVRLYVGASLSGDGVWPEVPRSFTDAETAAALAADLAAQKADEAAASAAAAAAATEDLATRRDVDELEEALHLTDRALTAHETNAAAHVTAAERAAWNAKVDPVQYQSDLQAAVQMLQALSAELDYKADSAALEQHAADTQLHVTEAERAAWNAKAEPESALEPILTHTCDGTETSSTYFSTDDNGDAYRLKRAVLRVTLGAVSAAGTFSADLMSGASKRIGQCYAGYTAASTGYRYLCVAEPVSGYWTQRQTNWSNGIGTENLQVNYSYVDAEADWPHIDRVRLTRAVPAGTVIELLGVRV